MCNLRETAYGLVSNFLKHVLARRKQRREAVQGQHRQDGLDASIEVLGEAGVGAPASRITSGPPETIETLLKDVMSKLERVDIAMRTIHARLNEAKSTSTWSQTTAAAAAPATQTNVDSPDTPVDHGKLVLLPYELVALIADELPLLSRVLLAQTCHRMRAVLRHRDRDHDAYALAHLPRADFLGYLSVMARDLPGHWVCELCSTLHPICTRDAPMQLCPVESPYGVAHLSRWYGGDVPECAGRSPIAHRHVQLALKYARMARDNGPLPPDQQQYRDRLMAPFDVRPSQYAGNRANNDPLTPAYGQHSTFVPKVVVGVDGRLRYLLFTTLRMDGEPGRAFVEDRTDSWDICPHQGPDYENRVWRDALAQGDEYRGRPPTFGPLFDLARAIRTAAAAAEAAAAAATVDRSQRRVASPDDVSHRPCRPTTTITGDDRPGGGDDLEVRGCCPRCPTDFAVRVVAHSRVEIRTWQDLGPEGPCTDMAWQIQTSGYFVGNGRADGSEFNYHKSGPTVHHVSGSVRELYEREPYGTVTAKP
ncbi:hypothetical protein SPI_03748 [Niveomyces insectorum RCEF 264]|uniref:F-box domain-containing protein n=1 Tax=Niveomyces insectorum RCEF 264 TaxID=1081102 RepID=A0A167WBQ2_9HYPO|nr:hypothetical protein SPI_03748 [Niveomyces insectorum RCEF 264]